MSIIVPAGNKNVAWSPKEEEKLQKTAAVGAEIKEDVNPLYEAAKEFVKSAAGMCDKCNKPKNFCKCEKSDAKSDTKSEVVDAGFDSAISSDEKSSDDEKSAIIEVESPAGEAAEEAGKGKIEEAVSKIEEAVTEIKDAAEIAGAAEEAEIEIEVDSVPDSEIPGKEISDSEIIVKSEPNMDACACAAKASSDAKEVAMDKSAAAEEEFCKFAKLSSANRKKLADYWVNMLGFPKDYVSLMTKDYEK